MTRTSGTGGQITQRGWKAFWAATLEECVSGLASEAGRKSASVAWAGIEKATTTVGPDGTETDAVTFSVSVQVGAEGRTERRWYGYVRVTEPSGAVRSTAFARTDAAPAQAEIGSRT